MKTLLDPMLFNYVIMGMYAVNMLQFSIRRDFGNASYWLGALWITASVTFFLQPK